MRVDTPWRCFNWPSASTLRTWPGLRVLFLQT
jgi:hypothetical protein